MALPNSGSSISLNQVNVELGYSGTQSITMNDSAVRTLFGKASGAISMSDGYGKSNIPTPTGVTLMDTGAYTTRLEYTPNITYYAVFYKDTGSGWTYVGYNSPSGTTKLYYDFTGLPDNTTGLKVGVAFSTSSGGTTKGSIADYTFDTPEAQNISTGGTLKYYGNYAFHYFTSSANFQWTALPYGYNQAVKIVVAGGGFAGEGGQLYMGNGGSGGTSGYTKYFNDVLYYTPSAAYYTNTNYYVTVGGASSNSSAFGIVSNAAGHNEAPGGAGGAQNGTSADGSPGGDGSAYEPFDPWTGTTAYSNSYARPGWMLTGTYSGGGGGGGAYYNFSGGSGGGYAGVQDSGVYSGGGGAGGAGADDGVNGGNSAANIGGGGGGGGGAGYDSGVAGDGGQGGSGYVLVYYKYCNL